MIAISYTEREVLYDGTQLRSHFVSDLIGKPPMQDTIVGFIGPARVPTKHLVDMADVKAGAVISADKMLHFLVERFDRWDVQAAVMMQRLLVMQLREILEPFLRDERGPSMPPANYWLLSRKGDDLYIKKPLSETPLKLTVSIATVSPVSALVHLGVNCVSTGGPEGLAIGSLADLKIDPKTVAVALIHRFAAEMNAIREASRKVRAVY